MEFLIVIPIISLVFSLFCYIKYRKGNRLIISDNIEIPYQYNSAEIAYLYKGYLKENDLLTILISLANRGYLKFIELDDGYKLGTNNSFLIEKVKDYDKDNAVEKIIFEKLFQSKNVVELKDIEYNFYNTLREAKNSIDNIDNKEKLFFKNVKRDKLILLFLIILSTFCINFNSIYLFTNNYLLIPIIVMIMLLGLYFIFISKINQILKLIIGIILIGIGLYFGIIPLINDISLLLVYIISIIIIIIVSYIYKIIPIRTIYGNKVLGIIMGFKKSLDNLDNSLLQKKIDEDSNYFYELYPYIYVFEKTNMWINKGSKLITEYPSWYQTHEEFSLINFEKFIKNMISLLTQAMFKKQLTGQSSVHVEYSKEKIK